MKSSKEKYIRFLPYLLITVGIILFVFSNGRWIISFAAWIAPVFLLRFLRIKRTSLSLVLLFILFAFASRIMLYGIIPSMLGVLTYILTVYYAILWFFPYLLDRLIAPKINGFISTLVFPVAAVSAEYINNLFYGSWASVAYTQFDNLSLIQISSVLGIWGVTFIVMWFASTAVWVLDNRIQWPVIKNGVVIYSSILALALLYGGLRLSVFSPQSKTAKITSFTATKELENYSREREERGFSSSIDMAKKDRDFQLTLLNKIYDSLFLHNKKLISPDVSIIFWAEGMISVLEENEEAFIARGRELTIEKNVYLLMAYLVIPKNNPGVSGENKSVLINPKGEIEWEYLKTHPVPGSTNLAGDGILPVSNTSFGKISSAICYDMDFTSLLNAAGKANVDIMLVPAWDWKAIDPLHARMAVYRAIENGFSMVRQTGEGLSIAVDYNGSVLATMDHFTATDHTMVSQIPVKGVKTVYSIIGDLFAWLCIAGLVFFILSPFFRKHTSLKRSIF